MNSKIIIITVLILVKIIAVASRAKADEVYFACNNEAEFQLIAAFNSPTYRCGNSPELIRI
jgi:hypothetical protein